MIGQTTNQANNPPKDGAILPPTIDVDKHELTEQELADMTPMRLAERIQQMEEAFKLLGPVEDVLNRIKCLEKWLFAGKTCSPLTRQAYSLTLQRVSFTN